MKKLLYILLVFCLLAATGLASKVSDINFEKNQNLVDSEGNHTAGAVSRVSAVTGTNSSGVLTTFWGDRDQEIATANQIIDTNWPLTIGVTIGETYTLSTNTVAATITVAEDTATLTGVGDATYGSGNHFNFTCTASGDITLSVAGSTVPNAMLEKLPSGNEIGSDLFDQETTTTREAAYDTVVGTIYRIVTQNTLDFTSVGAADNSVGTVFIADAVDTLGAGDELAEITAPHKGTYGWPYSAGDEVSTTQNASAPIGITEQEDTDGWTGTGTSPEASGDEDYSGTWSVKTTTDDVDEGAYFDITVVDNTFYKLDLYYLVDSGTIKIEVGDGSTADLYGSSSGLTDATFTNYPLYVYTAGTTLRVTFSEDAGDNAAVFFVDQLSVRPVQTSWTPYVTNTMEIDESSGAFKITGVDDSAGAMLRLINSTDLTANVVIGNWYKLNFDFKVGATHTAGYRINDGTVSMDYTGFINTSFESQEVIFQAIDTDPYIRGLNLAATEEIYFKDITIQKIPDLALLSPSDFINSDTIPAQPAFACIGSDCGLVIEGSGTNLLYYSEDFTQWTNSSTTDTEDISGPDNGTSNATTLLATGANGTILYTVPETLDGSDYTFSIWMKALTVTGDIELTEDDGGSWTTKTLTSSWQRFSVTGTETDPVVGVRIVADTDSVAIFGADLKVQNYLSSYVPTDGNPVARSTAAADGTLGHQWTQSQAIQNMLGEGGTVEGTMVVEWTALQDHDAVDTGARGLVTVKEGLDSVLSFHATEGGITTEDGTNTGTIAGIDWSSGDNLTTVSRWSKTGDDLFLVNEINDVWDMNAGNEEAFDDDFVPATKTWLSWANELPILIKRIRIYDEYPVIRYRGRNILFFTSGVSSSVEGWYED